MSQHREMRATQLVTPEALSCIVSCTLLTPAHANVTAVSPGVRPSAPVPILAAHQRSPDDVLVQRRVLLRVRRAAGLVVVRRAIGGRLLVLRRAHFTLQTFL